MQRTYLFVPPEEKAEVQALGALWDGASKRWYIDQGQTTTAFARWLPGAEENGALADEAFAIVSDQAYVASTSTLCQECNSNIEVICIHCDTGTVADEPLARFTVSHVWAVHDELAQQLQPWPNFRRTSRANEVLFANHCPNCGATQDDLHLHSEPGDPFFDVPGASPGSIELTPLTGIVRLSGDQHFQVD